jgi:hypothetical protein
VALWSSASRLWTVAREIEDLLQLQRSIRTTLQSMDDRLTALENRMTTLLACQGQLIAEAGAAAGVAATEFAASMVADILTRLARVERRQDDLLNRLPQPV